MLCAVLAAPALHAKTRSKKREEEPKTQVLPLPKELPNALSAPTSALVFHVSPLLRTGKLTAQIKEALGDLIRQAHGEKIVKLRAFVAGAGDARRVQMLVSEMFPEKRLPLPVLSIVQVGALSDDGAQVVIQAVAEGRQGANPSGLGFFASDDPASLGGAVRRLGEQMEQAQLASGDTLICTCITGDLPPGPAAHQAITAIFPHAVPTVVQGQRNAGSGGATCEAVARLRQAPAMPVNRLPQQRATLIHTSELVFTGLQLSFGNYLDDAKSALEHLQRAAQLQHASADGLAELTAFSLNEQAAAALTKTAPRFSVPPSSLVVERVEGLASLDALLGIEAVFAANEAASWNRPRGADSPPVR